MHLPSYWDVFFCIRSSWYWLQLDFFLTVRLVQDVLINHWMFEFSVSSSFWKLNFVDFFFLKNVCCQDWIDVFFLFMNISLVRGWFSHRCILKSELHQNPENAKKNCKIFQILTRPILLSHVQEICSKEKSKIKLGQARG